MNSPVYWKTSLEDVDQMYASAAKATEKRVLCYSAGGRPVYMLAYGQEKKKHQQHLVHMTVPVTTILPIPMPRLF